VIDESQRLGRPGAGMPGPDTTTVVRPTTPAPATRTPGLLHAAGATHGPGGLVVSVVIVAILVLALLAMLGVRRRRRVRSGAREPL
jgi:MYXO-CTERM domain-containing protein